MTEPNNQASNQAMNKAQAAYLAYLQTASERELTSDELQEFNELSSTYRISGLDELLGVAITHLGPDRVSLTLDISHKHLQPWGLANGGVYASLGETAGSIAAFIAAGAKAPVVGINNNTDFYRSAKDGDTVHTTATPVHLGRTGQVWEIQHTRVSDNALLARTNLRLQVLPA